MLNREELNKVRKEGLELGASHEVIYGNGRFEKAGSVGEFLRY